MKNPKSMVTDYSSLKIGDSVKFSLVRDRKKPDRIEYLVGRVLRESIIGWIAQTNTGKISGAMHGVTEKNYIGHWKGPSCTVGATLPGR